MATLIKTDGTQQEVHPVNGKRFSLEELQGFVGGLVELLDLGEGVMWINEEGKLIDLPFNRTATRLARPYLFPWDDGIRGDVLVLSAQEDRDSRVGDEDEDLPLAA